MYTASVISNKYSHAGNSELHIQTFDCTRRVEHILIVHKLQVQANFFKWGTAYTTTRNELKIHEMTAFEPLFLFPSHHHHHRRHHYRHPASVVQRQDKCERMCVTMVAQNAGSSLSLSHVQIFFRSFNRDSLVWYLFTFVCLWFSCLSTHFSVPMVISAFGLCVFMHIILRASSYQSPQLARETLPQLRCLHSRQCLSQFVQQYCTASETGICVRIVCIANAHIFSYISSRLWLWHRCTWSCARVRNIFFEVKGSDLKKEWYNIHTLCALRSCTICIQFELLLGQ